MTGFFPLLRLQLLSRFADMKPKNLKTAFKEKRGRTVGMFIAVLILIVYMAGFLYFIEKKALDLMMPMGMGDVIVSLSVILATGATLIMAFFFVMSSLYMGRDAAYIAALPVKSRTVLSAKLAQVWVSETAIDAVIILPACIQYGIRAGMPADFYLRMVIVWLTAAILPVAIISLVSALVIRISALWKHREIIATVGGIAFFIAYMFLMMNIGQITGDAADGGEMITQLILSNTARIQSMTGLFPPAAWAAEGILGNWAKLGLFVLVSLAAIALVIWILGYPYRKLSLLVTETPASSAKGGIRKGAIREGNAYIANVKRELKQILRVPSYMMNIIPICFMPLIFVIMITVIIGSKIGDDGESLQVVFSTLNPALVMGILAAIMAYVGGMNPALSTAVTREGKGHDFLIGLPVSGHTLIKAKFTVGCGLSLLGMIAATIALVIVFSAARLEAILAFVLCALFVYAAACIALTHDIKHPKFNWTTEQEAVKQNFGVMISMLVSWGILILLAVGTYFMISAGWGIWPVFMILASALAVLCVALRAHMYKTVDKYYTKQ
jgi:ABC-2 type transport system permease protein